MSILLYASFAWADRITVTDCSGLTRLEKDISKDDQQDLMLKVSDKKAETTFKITNTSTGESKVAIWKDGALILQGISAGVWKICKFTGAVLIPSETFTDISVIGQSATVASTTTGAAAAAAAATTTSTLIAPLAAVGVIGGGLAAAELSTNSNSDAPMSPIL